MESVLEFQNISKYFPGVKALDQVSFQAHSGEVLAFWVKTARANLHCSRF